VWKSLTSRALAEFVAQTRPTPLTESDCYLKGFFERSAEKGTSFTNFVQLVRGMGRSSGKEKIQGGDGTLVKVIPTDFQHPNRRFPYTPVGKLLLPAGTQWRARSNSTPVRPRKGARCVHTTFIFAKNKAMQLRCSAAQNALNLRVGGSTHAEVVIKDDTLQDVPMYRRHAKTKIPVERPGRLVQRLVWHGEAFRHEWQLQSVYTTGPSSLSRVQVPLSKKPRVFSQSALKTEWGESQVRGAITAEWEWLRCRYLRVKRSRRDVLKSLIGNQRGQWRQADLKASEVGSLVMHEDFRDAE
jgi:hypothetical protein